MTKENRLPWFPCEPSKLIAALMAMKPHVAYTYWMVCLRIYEIGGPCPDTVEVIARRTGYNKRIVADALDFLFATGKLVQTGDGIMNPYAERILYEQSIRVAEKDDAAVAGALAKWGVAPDRINKMKRSERLAAARKLGTHTEFEWMTLVAFCGKKCLRCGLDRKLVKDHIKPLYQGGSDAIENIQPLCQPCNSSKGPEVKDLRPHGWKNVVFSTNDACETPAERLPDAYEMPAQLQLQVTSTEERKKESKSRAPRSAAQTMLPEDWTLSAADRDYARKKGFSDSRIDQEFQNFRNHHIGHQTKWARWDLAWHTWINNEIKWAQSRRKNNGSTNQRPTRDEAIVAGVVRVAHQLVGSGYNRWANEKVPTHSDTNTDSRRALEYRGPDSKN